MVRASVGVMGDGVLMPKYWRSAMRMIVDFSLLGISSSFLAICSSSRKDLYAMLVITSPCVRLWGGVLDCAVVCSTVLHVNQYVRWHIVILKKINKKMPDFIQSGQM